jgi:hypothetical protein
MDVDDDAANVNCDDEDAEDDINALEVDAVDDSPTTCVRGRARTVRIKVRNDADKTVLRQVRYRPRMWKPRAATDIFAWGLAEMKRKDVNGGRKRKAARDRRKRLAVAEMYSRQEALAQRQDILQPLTENDLKTTVRHRLLLRSMWANVCKDEVCLSAMH